MTDVQESFPEGYAYGWHDRDTAGAIARRGLNEDVVRDISERKGEPKWMLEARLKALQMFERKPMPAWGSDLSGIDFDNIKYFVRSTEKQAQSWEELPDDIRETYDRLGIPEAEKQRLVAGVAAQYESEVVYHKIREDLAEQGVIFLDTDTGLREHEDMFREYFGSVIPTGDNKFSALNTAVWSGGSFIYIPKGVHVQIPLQAYFRINTENMGQFERTLIIVDEGAYVHYVEGCLPAGGLIDMADGTSVPIEDVQVSDVVRDMTGRAVPVTDTMTRAYSGTLHTIGLSGMLDPLQLTSEHPLPVIPHNTITTPSGRGGRGRQLPEVRTQALLTAVPEWLPAEQVSEGDFLVVPRERQDDSVEALPNALARLTGYYLATGSTTSLDDTKVVTFNLHEAEEHEAEEIRDLVRLLYGTRGSLTRIPAKHTITVSVSNAVMHDWIAEHVGTTTTKRLSREVFHQDDTFIRDLIDAYRNGDGRIARLNKHSGTATRRAATISVEWARQLQRLLSRLGMFATIKPQRSGGTDESMGRSVTRQPLYRVVWTHRAPDSTGQVGPYSTGTGVRFDGERFLVPVKSVIVEQYDGPVFNIETAPAHTYCASGVAVHNCTAPIYSSDSLHSAVVEIIVKAGARCRYTTIQNWSNNVYNLVTKRAVAHAGATMEWIDGNIGSKVTMKYPAVWLVGEHARGETLSIAFAGEGQHQDAGAKMVHAAPNTSSTIVSKSVARGGGRTSYRGLVQVGEDAPGSRSTVKCDALLVDDVSRSDTYPYVDVRTDDAAMGHEATVSKISADQLFYLMSRGISEDEAMAMIVRGFIEPIARELPMEYALELNRLIALQMEDAVG